MRLKYIVLCAVLLSTLTLPGGCGKKAPPFLPKAKEKFSLLVEGLKAGEEDGQIRLSGVVILPEGQRGKLPVFETCRVYHVRYPAESPPCDGCPISFTAYEEIRPDISSDGRFSCDTRLKKIPGIYYFMVRLVDPGGTVGPPSSRARLLVK